jgi:hypothetical protein
MLVNKSFTAPATVTLHANGTLEILNKTTGTWEPCTAPLTIAQGDGELFRVL